MDRRDTYHTRCALCAGGTQDNVSRAASQYDRLSSTARLVNVPRKQRQRPRRTPAVCANPS